MIGTSLIIVVLALAGLVLISFAAEAMRTEPKAPTFLTWAPDLAIQTVRIDGISLRYIRTGAGPPLVLLHTLRTQLDIFQKMIPELAKAFTVYAPDYPGHGWSDIPRTDYSPAFFVESVSKFLDSQRIEKATVAGVSIGGTIALLLAARRHPAVARVVAINPYDYARGLGITRANFVAWLIFSAARLPVVGETFMRLRNPLVESQIMAGGVADPASLPPSFLRETYAVGCRRGHYRAFLNLIRHADQWDDAKAEYAKITVPVLLIYGDKDWSHEAERRSTFEKIPGARLEVISNGGHFLPLDRPQELTELVIRFAAP
ncbi:MAG TPA: alpha/beta hydrolase [Burkholderiaceae bacterium]|jgi:pimeloyl-ACP methyl ester carboxylesterase|nr:alpha/beta hydrolase [Burkholderiaceae bacterium]